MQIILTLDMQVVGMYLICAYEHDFNVIFSRFIFNN